MGIALDAASQQYSKKINEYGQTGTPVGQALFNGFLDGFTQGHRSHANITVQALQVLLDGFKEPVSIKSARERVKALQLAIKSGSGL